MNEKNKVKKPSVFKYCCEKAKIWKDWHPLIRIPSSTFGSAFIIAIILLLFRVPFKEVINQYVFLGMGFSFLIALTNELIVLNYKNDKNWKEHLKQDKEHINEIIGRAPIVLRMDIEKFNSNHVKVIQDIFESLKSSDVNEVYALDDTPPNQWWTNSMLGYLAVQAQWAGKINTFNRERKVYRFFIISYGELGSVAGLKIIQMHALLGFETYVIFEPIFDNLFDSFFKNDSSVKKKEFFVWNNFSSCLASISIPQEYKGRKIYGYQSFWNIDTPDNIRLTDRNYDIKNNPVKNLADDNAYPVKFEYIFVNKDNKFIEHAKRHYDFALFLKNGAKKCVDTDEITKYFEIDNLYVHIPPSINGTGPIDITTVSKIIDKYLEYYVHHYKTYCLKEKRLEV